MKIKCRDQCTEVFETEVQIGSVVICPKCKGRFKVEQRDFDNAKPKPSPMPVPEPKPEVSQLITVGSDCLWNCGGD